MYNLLITGSTGFVGKNLIPYLVSKGYKTKTVSNRDDSETNISYEKLKSNTWVDSFAWIHLAGKAHDLKNLVNEDEYYKINTELTKTLFDVFLKSNSSVFVYLSSVKAVADKIEIVLTEDVVPKPKTIYGKSKLAAEQYLLSYKLPKGKKLYILRPCLIYGKGSKGNLNLLYNFVKYRIPYPLGRFENKRSFLSVDNLCFIINSLLEKLPKSGIYNVADDKELSTNDLIFIISETFRKKPIILNIPKWMIILIAKIGTFFKLTFDEEKLGKLTESYIVSNSKIKKELGIELPIDIKKGLLKTFK